MKNFALKLVAVLEIISGIVGVSLALFTFIGMWDFDLTRLWYGVLPLASLAAGVFLWRRSKWAFVLSCLVQLFQVPVIRSAGSSLDFVVAMKLPISAIWCAGDNCRVKLVLGIDFLALGILFILLWSRSALSNSSAAGGGIEQARGADSPVRGRFS